MVTRLYTNLFIVGYSGADLASLCKAAALIPLRSVLEKLSTIQIDELPPITYKDFITVLETVRPSVSRNDVTMLEQFNRDFGNV